MQEADIGKWKTGEATLSGLNFDREIEMARCCARFLVVGCFVCLAGWGLPAADAGLFSSDGGWCSPWARHERAGNPHCVAPWARTTYGPDYSGYYVGGGNPRLGGDERCPCEGTWGVDYSPWWSRVRLNWWHGRRYQGGEGQYEPDERNRPLLNGRPPRSERY